MASVTATQMATFINTIAPIAVEQAKKHGMKIFPSVCIAQAIHESGWGTSTKMVRANALFGIKVGKSAYHFGTAWKGASYNTKTKEYYNGNTTASVITDNFRAYDSLSDATEDYFDLLCTASRYKAALNAVDYKACIRAIAPAYATGESQNNAYSKAIISIIEKHNLTKYDNGTVPAVPVGNPYKRTDNVMKSGSRGESVKWLQYVLNEKGYDLKIDGIFGPKTEQAVRDFQTKVFVDGIVGELTLKKLD